MMRSAILFLAALAGCQADEPATGGPGASDTVDTGDAGCTTGDHVPTEGALSVADASDAFGWDLYQSLAAGEDGNLFFSPFSITAALSMTYAGAAGTTAAEMADVLHIDTDDDAYHAGFGDLIDAVLADSGDCIVQISLANRLFGQDDFPWLDPFLQITAEDYSAPLEEIDFVSDPEAARVEINDWVAAQTADRIPDLIPEDVITVDTRLVLANAIYFKADWLTAFDEDETFDGSFTRPDGSSVSAPIMHRGEAEATLGRVDSATVLELPYDGEQQSMLFLLPDTPDGLPALEASLDNAFIDRAVASLSVIEEAEVYLPRFSIDGRVPLKAQLQALGMPTAFEQGSADLTGMAAPEDARLYIQDALHRAFIEVNEAGSEAAAATAVVVGTESAAPGFYGMHPFVFLVRDNATGAVLFLGRVADPTAE